MYHYLTHIDRKNYECERDRQYERHFEIASSWAQVTKPEFI